MKFLLLLGLIGRIYGRDWIVRASDWNKGRLYLAEKFGYGKRLKLNLNQFGHEGCRHRLDIGDKRPPSPGSKYFSENFSPSHTKLTNSNPNKDY